jgi:hypothetical protein
LTVGCDVYANSNAIACKAGDAKVIASFPDVCLSPPSPPAGPVPIPYPNTSFDKDMQNGSKTVMIKDQEVMLKDQSFYKTAPLGDEAATNSFGGSVVTHVITGKTYFQAWSMDVQFEGQNVDRNLDLTGSNCASGPPSSVSGNISEPEPPPPPKVCECCGEEGHSAGKAMSMSEWYEDKNSGLPEKVEGTWSKGVYTPPDPNTPTKEGMRALLQKATPEGRKKAGCTCHLLRPPNKKRTLTPEPPCDKFYKTTKAERDKIDEEWNAYAPTYKKAQGIPSYQDQIAALKETIPYKRATLKEQQRMAAKFPTEDDPGLRRQRQVNHLVPKSAGGCPGKPGKEGEPSKDGNLQNNMDLCPVCQGIDAEFSKYQ